MSALLNVDCSHDSKATHVQQAFEHLQDWPGFNLIRTRIIFKLREDKFQYMVIADNRQRTMPLPEDRSEGEELRPPEAVLLPNGEVDDKYQCFSENKALHVHGWKCDDPSVGFWQITPSNEFRSGGPVKQNLTSHVGPYTLAMFLSTHYVGEDMVLKLEQGEYWKKVFGPVFMYLNEGDWKEAKQQMSSEVQNWPHSFPASEDFPSSDQRGSFSGRLQVRDSYVSDEYIPADGAFVGLAPAGEVGSWQTESKGYQFWSRAGGNGNFTIYYIRTGEYNIYAWVPGFLGDYRYDVTINISEGSEINVGDLIYETPRDGAALWEIGIPDRLAAEFYVPDPDPMYHNSLYDNHPDRYRQCGLWKRYAELYPDEDLVFTVGTSDHTKDWFYAQVNRLIDVDTDSYQATTWQIRFKLETEDYDDGGTHKLRLALATAQEAELQVRINDAEADPLFTTGQIAHDNAIARYGIHGLYRLYNVDVPSEQLAVGENTIFLTQVHADGFEQGIMYDYIRPPPPPPPLHSSNRQL